MFSSVKLKRNKVQQYKVSSRRALKKKTAYRQFATGFGLDEQEQKRNK